MASLLSGVEATVINTVVGGVLTKLHRISEEDFALRGDLKRSLDDMKSEMQMIKHYTVRYAGSKDHQLHIHELGEIALRIEDCIDKFEMEVACKPGLTWCRQKWHDVKTMNARTRFAEELRDLKRNVVDTVDRKERYLSSSDPQPARDQPGCSTRFPSYTPEAELVGIHKQKAEILELLTVEQELRLRVVSVLGPWGIGKSAIVRAIFNDPAVISQFPCRAWVVASEHSGAEELLQEILRQVRASSPSSSSSSSSSSSAPSSSSGGHPGEDLRTHLQANSRYMIVIDNVQTSVLDTMGSYFPGKDGRIIVTTSMKSIANACSTNGVYIHIMRALDEEDSKTMFLKMVYGSVPNRLTPHLEGGLEIILRKCEGLPLGIVMFSNFLRSQGPERITMDSCNEVCSKLGSHIQSNPALAIMKQVLIHSYENLPRHDLKICLFSISVYPGNEPIKRKCIIRRWLNEGLVVKDGNRSDEEVARANFDDLVDRCIIQPVDFSNNGAVKTCQLHPIMLDFIVHRAASDNFVTTVHGDEVTTQQTSHSAVRRMFLDKPTEKSGKAVMQIDTSRTRSLTISDYEGRSLVVSHNFKLLRVLHVEKCKGLTKSDLDGIFKLLQLKFLSFRGTDITNLPEQVSNLLRLEILDIRETRVNRLCKEVLDLPKLAQLFGKFKLPCELGRAAKRGNSELQTLSGVVMDESPCFEQIMVYMKKLGKLNIMFESNPTPGNKMTDHQVSSLNTRLSTTNTLEALSIDFGDHSIDFLGSLDYRCTITSIKLQGTLGELPDIVKLLSGLRELHLSKTGLTSEALSSLQTLPLLIYLTLKEDSTQFGNGSFCVQGDGFLSLKRLCIEAQKLPEMSIAEGAMQHLYSLWLISADITGLSEGMIKHLEGLKQVALGTSVHADTRISWEAAMKQHKNRPTLLSI